MLQQILSDTAAWTGGAMFLVSSPELARVVNLGAHKAAMEAEGTRAEKSAQVAYESFAKDTTASVEKKEEET